MYVHVLLLLQQIGATFVDSVGSLGHKFAQLAIDNRFVFQNERANETGVQLLSAHRHRQMKI